jgi:hypothetical protein
MKIQLRKNLILFLRKQHQKKMRKTTKYRRFELAAKEDNTDATGGNDTSSNTWQIIDMLSFMHYCQRKQAGTQSTAIQMASNTACNLPCLLSY